jgi:hypothetical protein
MNKPKTKREWALWRCKMMAEKAQYSLEGKLHNTEEPDNQIRETLYNIASAIGDLAEALGADEQGENKP